MKMSTNYIISVLLLLIMIIMAFELVEGINGSSQFNCSDPQGLPCDEAYVLRDVINGLKLSKLRDSKDPADFTRQNCSVDTDSISITCTCSYQNNILICHVTEITTSNLHLSDGIIHENVSLLLYLEGLNLVNNHLRCKIPYSLGSLKALKTLDLYNNFLRGPIPPSLGNLTLLVTLDLSRNMLSGEIPKELGKLSKLELMNLGENELEGGIPWQLGNLINLETLMLGSNYLDGVLDSFHKLSYIEVFAVGGNSFHGPIPKFISKWNDLTALDLSGNDFEGNLPLEIFEMSNLEYLLVSDLKSVEDFVFPKQANLPNIEILVLRNCNISGSIPKVIGNWSQLSYLDLSFNSLSGAIPDALQYVPVMRNSSLA